MSLHFTQFGLSEGEGAGAVLHSAARDELRGNSRRESVQQAAHEARRSADGDESTPRSQVAAQETASENLDHAVEEMEMSWLHAHAHPHHNPIEGHEHHDPNSYSGVEELYRGIADGAAHEHEGVAHAKVEALPPYTRLTAGQVARIGEQYRQLLELDKDNAVDRRHRGKINNRIKVHAVSEIGGELPDRERWSE